MRRVSRDEVRTAMKRATLDAVTYDHEEDEPQNRDEAFALALISGFYRRPPDGKISHQFTVRYDPRFKRIYLTPNRYGHRVGDIRKILSGGQGAAS